MAASVAHSIGTIAKEVQSEIESVTQRKRVDRGVVTDLYGTNKQFDIVKEKLVVPKLIKGVQTMHDIRSSETMTDPPVRNCQDQELQVDI
jgi:hypothetical protein